MQKSKESRKIVEWQWRILVEIVKLFTSSKKDLNANYCFGQSEGVSRGARTGVVLFSEQDLPGSAHTDSGLIGSAIRSGLQSNDRFTSLQLLFSEMTPILLAGTRAEPRTAPFRMFVGGSSQGEDGGRHGRNVLPLGEIGRLENVQLGDTVLFASFLESVDILDHLEVAGTVVDLADGSWSQFAHQLAQQDAILQPFFVTGTFRKRFTGDDLDPLLGLIFLFRFAFTSSLPPRTRHFQNDSLGQKLCTSSMVDR